MSNCENKTTQMQKRKERPLKFEPTRCSDRAELTAAGKMSVEMCERAIVTEL
jgi:hypothetical protein